MTAADRFVTISCFRGEPIGFAATGQNALVAVDVIRATTTAITAVAQGRRCFPVSTLEAAARLQAQLEAPLVAGELGGQMPPGFHITNSPAALAARDDISRPMILLSSSGTQLLCAARGNVYLGCLRNYGALVEYLPDHHGNVMLVGAGTHGEFREEDALCCAWIAAGLIRRGYKPSDADTQDLVTQWAGRSVQAILAGKSSDYLRATHQWDDLQFILDHVNDLDCIPRRVDGEVIPIADGFALANASR
jgi:2-phosphosulfolactate phosphatase